MNLECLFFVINMKYCFFNLGHLFYECGTPYLRPRTFCVLLKNTLSSRDKCSLIIFHINISTWGLDGWIYCNNKHNDGIKI